MEQDNDAGGFVPTSLDALLRAEPGTLPKEPAGRQETEAASPEPVEKGEAPAAPPEPKDDRPRDASGKFIPKAEEAKPEQSAPPADDQPQSDRVPKSALIEERKKRQALEQRLRELETRAAQPAPPPVPQAPQQPQVALSDMLFQDPARFVEVMQKQQEEALLATRIATSEAMARQQPDYADAEAALTALAQSSPVAARQISEALRAHPAPAMWALEQGRKLIAQQRWQPLMQQHQDPDAWINAEVERRMSERMASAPAPSSVPHAPPASLASVRSSAPRSGAAPWSGPTPMSAIVGRR